MTSHEDVVAERRARRPVVLERHHFVPALARTGRFIRAFLVIERQSVQLSPHATQVKFTQTPGHEVLYAFLSMSGGSSHRRVPLETFFATGCGFSPRQAVEFSRVERVYLEGDLLSFFLTEGDGRARLRRLSVSGHHRHRNLFIALLCVHCAGFPSPCAQRGHAPQSGTHVLLY